jgi:hypothetical protein
MAQDETKIKLIEDKDATGEVAKVYDEWRAKSGRQLMPGILKCFSHRPDFLREVMRFSDTVHFSEGHLAAKPKRQSQAGFHTSIVVRIDWTRMHTSCVFREQKRQPFRQLPRVSSIRQI